MKCYICFEKTWMKSPCFCQTPVHRKCLLKWTRESNRHQCSICAHDYYSPMLVFQTGLHNLVLALKKVFMVVIVLLSFRNGDKYKHVLEPFLFSIFVGILLGHSLEHFLYQVLSAYYRIKNP